MSTPCTSRDGERKKRWPNLAAAEFVARLAESNHGTRFDTYRCAACDGWHVTTRRGRSASSADRRAS